MDEWKEKLVGRLGRGFPGGARRFWVAAGCMSERKSEAQIKRGRNEDGRSRAGRSCLKWADARADGKSDFAPGKSRREERRWT